MYYDIETEKVRPGKLYSVGYNPKLNKYVLSATITWMAWYERYYEITEEEYNLFGTDVLDLLADDLYRAGTYSKRFLFSDKVKENTEGQLELMHKADCGPYNPELRNKE